MYIGAMNSGTVSRRRLIHGSLGLAGLAVLNGCGRLPWLAKPTIPRIGVLGGAGGTPDDPDNTAFRDGLRDLGYTEGQNIALEWRFPVGASPDQLPALATDLVRLPVDLIVAEGTGPNAAATQASP